MNWKHTFSNKKGFIIVEMLLGMFLFSFILTVIFSFIKTETVFYKKNSNKIISKLMFRELENILQTDFENISEILTYNKLPFEIKIKKNNKIICYTLQKKQGKIYIKREVDGITKIINPDLKIKRFQLDLKDINGHTIFTLSNPVFFKFKIEYIIDGEKTFNDFIVIENKRGF